MKICIPFYVSLFLIVSSSLAFTEKKIVVVITSYNNQKWYSRNLESVLSQNYTNFRVLYLDDFSPDGTGDLVEEYVIEHNLDQKVQLIKNTIRRGGLHNFYTMVYMCDDDEIVVNLDGDDWFPDDNVLTRLNNVYSSSEVWLTYGQFQTYPSGVNGWASPMPDSVIEANSFRYHPNLPTHLRTHYAWLFKQIKLEDLLYSGKFYSMVPDMAMMFPMIEMAGERHQFIPDIMYIYNQDNPLSEHHLNRQLQINLLTTLKNKNPYHRLIKKPIKKDTGNLTKSDAIIFAQNPTNLARLLKSLKTQVNGIDHIFIIYKPLSLLEIEDYNSVQNLYPEIEFYPINDIISHFRNTLVQIYDKTKNNYILFAKDDAIFTKSLSLCECIDAIEQTSAYAFYFKLNVQDGMKSYQHLSLLECKKNIYAWDFMTAEGRWSCANSIDLVLTKKTPYFIEMLSKFYDLSLNSLEHVWTNEAYVNHIGLCFNESYIRKIY
jgi:glycosyltransferase involved in cell wall biosynthesis